MRSQLELPNELAAALAGNQDELLRALERQLGCRVFLRGNLLTFDGEAGELDEGTRTSTSWSA